MTAQSIVEQIQQGTLSAHSHISHLMDTIKTKNPSINAFIHINDQALEQAKQIDQRIAQGKPTGKLAGLGIAIKSNISVTGMPITCASKTLENYTGTFDADVIKSIRDEHGIILGMLNMDEFACGSSGETSAYGPTQNPAAPGCIPGGSSSGSAAAVAAGMCDIALGSDTGGSIRNPASHCGIIGIKPSYGMVSRYGLIDLAMSLDQIGPLAKDVASASLMLDVIRGQSRNDPTTRSCDTVKKQNIRIGICPSIEKMCDKRIWKLIHDTLHTIAHTNNWSITPIQLPHIHLAIQAYYPIVYVEFFSGTRKFDARKYGKRIEDSCGPEVLRRIIGGQHISKAEFQGRYYHRALQAKQAISQEFTQAFTNCDVIITPATPSLPHHIGDNIDIQTMYGYDAFTTPANLSGICAGTVSGLHIDSIPVGMQILAPRFHDSVLIDVMKQCHQQIATLSSDNTQLASQ